MTLWKWSKTANSNATADSTINWAEGQAPSSVNNSARAEMAAVAKYRDDVAGILETGGSSTAYTITTNQGLTALTDGFKVTARMDATNGASATLAVDGLTAKQIRSVYGTNVPAGALLINSTWSFVYDSGDDAWIAHGAPGASTLLSAVNIAGGTELTAPAVGDELPIYDLDATANKKITLANALKVINGLTEDTAPASGDFLVSYDTSGTAAKKINLNRVRLQTVDATPYTSNTTLDTAIPFDDSVPTSSEGTEILTASITPVSASSKIEIDFAGFGTPSGTNSLCIAALFRGTTCIYVLASGTNTAQTNMSFKYVDSPSTTSATTYSIRVGAPTGTSGIRMNGTFSARAFGGTAACVMRLTETLTL